MDATTPTTPGMRQIEARIGRPVPEYLREAYLVRELAQVDIADELGVNAATVSRWMVMCGIEVRFVGHRKTRRAVA